MNTNIKKKGRIAMAWLIIIAMIFATMSTPFAFAKPSEEPIPTTPNVTIYGFGQYTPGGTTTTLPFDTDFIFFKQGSTQTENDNQQMYIWTKEAIPTSLQNDILAYLKWKDNSIKDDFTDVEFITGYGDPIDGTPYSVTLGDTGIIVKWLSGKLSHLDYGQYDQEFTITVKKLVTLNGEDLITGISGTVYVSLYSDAAFANRIATKSITINNGVAVAPATFKVNETGTYYVRESLNMNGDVLPSPTTLFGGYTLDSVEIDASAADSNEIVVTTTSTNEATITNNLSFNPKGSADVAATKALTGTEREPANGEFQFSLVQMTNSEFSTVMTNGHSQTVSNVAGGVITFDSIGYETADTYYYVMKEIIPADAIDGYLDGITYDDNEIFVTIEVIADGEGTDAKLIATVTYRDADENILKTPTFINNITGAILVTKEIQRPADETDLTVTYDFYAALFDSIEGTNRISDVKKLAVVDSESTTVLFDKLIIGKTYYLFETDPTGVKIATANDGTISLPGAASAEGYLLPDWQRVNYDTQEFEITPTTQEATITNYFDTNDLFFDPSIKVIKTVTVNNVPTASNLTFYAGLFEDKELTKLVAFKPLPMNGKTTADASFAFYQDGVTPLKVGTTYYVAETDKDGKPLAGTAKELGFEITINGVTNNNSTVELIEEEAIVNIVNNFKKEEFPLTGDNSNMNLWLFLAMLGVAGAIAPFAFRKKEELND